MKWTVVTRPEGRDLNKPDFEKNKGGLVFYLKELNDDDTEAYGGKLQEIGRVAFDRSKSANPRTGFAAQCDKIAKTAVAAVKFLNTDLMSDGTLQ